VAQAFLARVEPLKRTGAAWWRGYKAALAAKPLQTKALTSLVGLALGDVIAQV